MRPASRPLPAHLDSERGSGHGNGTASSPHPLRSRAVPTGRAGSEQAAGLRLRIPELPRLHSGLPARRAGLRAGEGSALWRTGGSGAAKRGARRAPAHPSRCAGDVRSPGASAAAGAVLGCDGTLGSSDSLPLHVRKGRL